MTTIQKHFALNPVTGGQSFYTKNKPEGPFIDPALLFGVELEIEGVPHWPDLEIQGMTSTADGSLRNNGREFLLLPTDYQNAVATLTEFFKRGNFSNKNYSERCSIHVHSNCLDLTFDQLQIILFIYQITEKVLFNWVNPERASNIFCVPWYDTNLQHGMFDEKFKPEKFKNWMKYTSLNLLPLYSYGTIEWRHMHGHCDTEKLFKWLRIISCFYRFARSQKLGEVKEFFLGLNTTSEYNRFIEQVFQQEVAFVFEQPTWERDLEEGVLLMKYSLASGKEKTSSTKKINIVFDDMPDFEAAQWPADQAAGLFHGVRPLGEPARPLQDAQMEHARRMMEEFARRQPAVPRQRRPNNNGGAA